MTSEQKNKIKIKLFSKKNNVITSKKGINDMVSLPGILLRPLNITNGIVTGFHQVLPMPEKLPQSMLGE